MELLASLNRRWWKEAVEVLGDILYTNRVQYKMFNNEQLRKNNKIKLLNEE